MLTMEKATQREHRGLGIITKLTSIIKPAVTRTLWIVCGLISRYWSM